MRRLLILPLLLTWVAINSFAAEVPDITAEALLADADQYYILDVRTQEEFDQGHVPGARLLPFDDIEPGHHQLPPDKNTPVVLYCRSGRRAGIAAETLIELGYDNLLHLAGDMQKWRQNNHPVSHASPTQ